MRCGQQSSVTSADPVAGGIFLSRVGCAKLARKRLSRDARIARASAGTPCAGKRLAAHGVPALAGGPDGDTYASPASLAHPTHDSQLEAWFSLNVQPVGWPRINTLMARNLEGRTVRAAGPASRLRSGIWTPFDDVDRRDVG